MTGRILSIDDSLSSNVSKLSIDDSLSSNVSFVHTCHFSSNVSFVNTE